MMLYMLFIEILFRMEKNFTQFEILIFHNIHHWLPNNLSEKVCESLEKTILKQLLLLFLLSVRCSQQSSTLSVVCLASRIEALTKIPFAGHPIRPTLSINLYSQGEVYKDAIRRAKLIRRVEVENICMYKVYKNYTLSCGIVLPSGSYRAEVTGKALESRPQEAAQWELRRRRRRMRKDGRGCSHRKGRTANLLAHWFYCLGVYFIA